MPHTASGREDNNSLQGIKLSDEEAELNAS